MSDRVFVVMQIGGKESPERKRADEIYEFVVSPAVAEVGLEAYRADLDLSPGGITPKLLSELLDARAVIADLTGRNPNVYYELGIAHSFGRPLISLGDSVSSLPFDAKDERVIELGTYEAAGLGYAQGETAKRALMDSLKIVLADGYEAPSPVRDVAGNRSLDALAPENPMAAELAQIRETLEDVRRRITPRRVVPTSVLANVEALRSVIDRNILAMDENDIDMLTNDKTSGDQDEWVREFAERWRGEKQRGSSTSDPWASGPASPDPWSAGGGSKEPPF